MTLEEVRCRGCATDTAEIVPRPATPNSPLANAWLLKNQAIGRVPESRVTAGTVLSGWPYRLDHEMEEVPDAHRLWNMCGTTSRLCRLCGDGLAGHPAEG